MLYLPMHSAENAADVSERIFACSRPVHVRSSEDVSNAYSETITHPSGTAWVLPVEENTTLYIHLEVDEHTFDALLQPFIDQCVVTDAERTALQDALDGARGGRLNVYAEFPAYWRNAAMTYEDLVNGGWFPEES